MKREKGQRSYESKGHLVLFNHCVDCSKEVPFGWKKDGWHCIEGRKRVYVCPACSQKRGLPAPDLTTFKKPKKEED